MPQSVQNDLKEGARSRWLATPALVAAIPAASLYAGDVQPQTTPPYATMRVEHVGREEFGAAVSGVAYVARERLVVSVWAIGSATQSAEDVAGDLAGLVQTAYANESWTVPDSTVIGVYPEGEASAEEDGKYQGNDVWRADVAFEVWLQRVEPTVG